MLSVAVSTGGRETRACVALDDRRHRHRGSVLYDLGDHQQLGAGQRSARLTDSDFRRGRSGDSGESSTNSDVRGRGRPSFAPHVTLVGGAAGSVDPEPYANDGSGWWRDVQPTLLHPAEVLDLLAFEESLVTVVP